MNPNDLKDKIFDFLYVFGPLSINEIENNFPDQESDFLRAQIWEMIKENQLLFDGEEMKFDISGLNSQ